MLLSPYGIIMDRGINPPGDGNIVVDGLNSTDKRYLKDKMTFMDKFGK